MGSTPRAHLAYGYDLGGYEDFKAAERDDYGSPRLPWLDEDAGTWGFIDQADRQLTASSVRGVEVYTSGSEDAVGWILITVGSERSVDWDLAMTLDPAEISVPRSEWDAGLTAALTALGITPTQDGPKWLVFPSYG